MPPSVPQNPTVSKCPYSHCRTPRAVMAPGPYRPDRRLLRTCCVPNEPNPISGHSDPQPPEIARPTRKAQAATITIPATPIHSMEIRRLHSASRRVPNEPNPIFGHADPPLSRIDAPNPTQPDPARHRPCQPLATGHQPPARHPPPSCHWPPATSHWPAQRYVSPILYGPPVPSAPCYLIYLSRNSLLQKQMARKEGVW